MPDGAGAPPLDEIAHVALRLGRLMLANGADTAHVQDAVVTFAGRLGDGAHLLVGAEGLLLTLERDGSFRTKLGLPVAGYAVNMGALATLDGIRRERPATRADIAAIEARLDAVEHARSTYPRWAVVLGMGVTAASLARLFGGAWTVVGVSALVGMATQLLRQELVRSAANPVAGAALAAFGGGLVGAVVMKAFPGQPATLCLVAAGMILVPGVPLINGVRDTFGQHVGTGIARLMLGIVTVLAIAFGLFLAAGVAGDQLPVDAASSSLALPEDLLFSALAGAGYAALFNVPPRAAWACIVCAMLGHGLRTALQHSGLDLPAASFVGAFAAAFVARLIAERLSVPAVTFAFPAVVAMIPGFFAFRAGIGGLAIMQAGASAPPALLGETIGLAVTAMLVTAAIAIGLCLAMALPLPAQAQPIQATRGTS